MKMWLPRVDFRTDRGVREDLWGQTSISPARAGTNILEYGRLTELSKDLQYLRNVCPFDHNLYRRRQHGGLLSNLRKKGYYLE